MNYTKEKFGIIRRFNLFMSFWLKILTIFERLVFILSKFAQSFSRTRPVFKLNESNDRLERTKEVVDIQEEVNSSYDELLFTRLEKYFADSVEVLPVDGPEIVEDLEEAFGSLSASNADRVLSAFEHVSALRARYGLSDDITNDEVIAFVRAKFNSQTEPVQAEPVQAEPVQAEGGDNNAQI